MNLINSKDYFMESEKVVEIVKQREDQLHRQIPTAERLRLVEEELKQAKTREEYEELKKIKEDLELRLRLKELRQPAIPPEHQEKIRQNREIEEIQAIEKLNELKAELSAKIEMIEKELIPLVTNFENLEKRLLIGTKVDFLLKGEISEERGFMSATHAARALSFSSDYYNARAAKKTLQKTVEALEKIQTPKQSKGFFKNIRKQAK